MKNCFLITKMALFLLFLFCQFAFAQQLQRLSLLPSGAPSGSKRLISQFPSGELGLVYDNIFYLSSDTGKTWQERYRFFNWQNPNYISAVPDVDEIIHPDTLYGTTYGGSFRPGTYVNGYQTSRIFSFCPPTVCNCTGNVLLTSLSLKNRFSLCMFNVNASRHDYSITATFDTLKTFQQVPLLKPIAGDRAFNLIRSNDNQSLLILGRNFILRSINQGVSFSDISGDLTTQASGKNVDIKWGIALNNTNLLVGAEMRDLVTNVISYGTFFSTNGGVNWNLGLFPPKLKIHSMVCSSTSTAYLLGTDTINGIDSIGIYKSEDFGVFWQRVPHNFGGLKGLIPRNSYDRGSIIATADGHFIGLYGNNLVTTKVDAVPLGISINLKTSVITAQPQPNPTANMFTIPGVGREGVLSLVNASGRVVRQESFVPGSEVDISALPKGLYLFRLVSEGAVTQGKVVRE